MSGNKLVISMLFAVLALTGCSKDKDEPTGNSTAKNGMVQELTERLRSILGQPKALKITNEQGEPLVADVMIGLKGSLSQTAQDGTLIIPATWVDAQPVTISAKGYVRTTFMSRLPVAQTFVVKVAPTANLEVAGENPGIQVEDGDDNADFTFVMPTMRAEDILHFDINTILSKQKDTIEVFGKKLNIPSNVTLPHQSEYYSFFSITLDKPRFRIYYNTPGKKTVYSARGQFPFKKVVDELRSGKEFFELANYFNILGGSVREVNVTAPTQNVTIPVTDMNYSQTMSVQSQGIAGTEILLGAALSDYQGQLFPTDVKSLNPGGTNALKVLGASPKMLSILQRRDDVTAGKGSSRISAVLVNFQNGVAPQHYALQENPRVMSPYTVQVQKVQPIKGVNELATYATLSRVQNVTREQAQYEVATTVWEVYAPTWVDQIEIPVWPGEVAPSGALRWAVSLAGSNGSSKVDQDLDLGPTVMQAITHVTSAAADF